MCKFCDVLVMCPIGEKRRAIIPNNGEGKSKDAYGHTLTIHPVTMYLDKDPKNGWSCGIYQEVYTEDFVQYGGGISITHCPFCGQRLL